MMAAARGNERIARMLLDNGADPTVYDTQGLLEELHPSGGAHKGETAAKTARRRGHRSLAAMLDAAERSHPKRWVEPARQPVDWSVESQVKAITDNRARLLARFAAYPPPSE